MDGLNFSELLTPSSSVGDIQRPRKQGHNDITAIIRYLLTPGTDSHVAYRHSCECQNINKREYSRITFFFFGSGGGAKIVSTFNARVVSDTVSSFLGSEHSSEVGLVLCL
jgi:hypothetical protein